MSISDIKAHNYSLSPRDYIEDTVKKEVWVNDNSLALVFLKVEDKTHDINYYEHWGQKVENAGRYIRKIYTKKELEEVLC